jgi:hypothetical protein
MYCYFNINHYYQHKYVEYIHVLTVAEYQDASPYVTQILIRLLSLDGFVAKRGGVCIGYRVMKGGEEG